MEEIVPEFRRDAGIVARLPVLILVMGLLTTCAITIIIFTVQPDGWLFATVVALAMLTAILLYARYRWQRGAIALDALRHASQLLQTANPQPVQVTSWRLYEHCWYLGIQPGGAMPDTHVQALRVWFPFSILRINCPTPAEIFSDGEVTVVRLQDGKTILLATAPDEFERLSEHPLPLPPRRIPLLVQVQVLTAHGVGIFLLCPAILMVFGLFDKPGVPIAKSAPPVGPSLAFSGICLIIIAIIFCIGYPALRRLKFAPLGWAHVEEIAPPEIKMGLILPGRQAIHLRIQDQLHQECSQQFITRQWMIHWPRHTEIPVLFDPTGHERPRQINEYRSYCRIDERGNSVLRPSMAVITVLYIVWAAFIAGQVFFGR